MSKSTASNALAVAALALSLLAAIGLAVGCTGIWRVQVGAAISPDLSPLLLLGLGAVLGFAVTASLVWLMSGAPGGASAMVAYATCAAAAAVVVARLDGLPFIPALLALLLGLGGFAALIHAIRLIGHGDALGAENHWGGFGNGLGGWRLTSASSLILLAILSCSAAVALATLPAAIHAAAAGPSTPAPDAPASRLGKPSDTAPQTTGR